jgi:phosphoribosylaminoimidazole carboxylase
MNSSMRPSPSLAFANSKFRSLAAISTKATLSPSKPSDAAKSLTSVSSDGLPRTAIVGVLGGGQLGRMMGLAAGNMGVKLKCLDPADEAPAAVAATHVKGHFRDAAAIQQFVSGGVDVLTVEIEHIDADALEEAARTSGISIQPTPSTIRVSAILDRANGL